MFGEKVIASRTLLLCSLPLLLPLALSDGSSFLSCSYFFFPSSCIVCLASTFLYVFLVPSSFFLFVDLLSFNPLFSLTPCKMLYILLAILWLLLCESGQWLQSMHSLGCVCAWVIFPFMLLLGSQGSDNVLERLDSHWTHTYTVFSTML